jgi:hypothetical protein
VPDNIRQDALNAVATLAIADPAFVVDAFEPDNLEATLSRHGFSLSAEELQQLSDFQDRVRANNEIDDLLRNPRVVQARRWRR